MPRPALRPSPVPLSVQETASAAYRPDLRGSNGDGYRGWGWGWGWGEPGPKGEGNVAAATTGEGEKEEKGEWDKRDQERGGWRGRGRGVLGCAGVTRGDGLGWLLTDPSPAVAGAGLPSAAAAPGQAHAPAVQPVQGPGAQRAHGARAKGRRGRGPALRPYSDSVLECTVL